MVGSAGLLSVVLYVSYETARARIPQHRETLERLVRAQTGLNVRFNGLNLRWGWSGPEVVFRRVELGEPGESTLLLRAAQLAVALDTWRSVQTGRLELGRITLVEPDIDLARTSRAVNVEGARVGRGGETRAITALRRWPGGRVELEGGTLRIPDPGGAIEPLSLQIRRGTLRRAGHKWSGQADILLPERLGRSLHLAIDLTGESPAAPDASGAVRFDGRNLQFAAWREILRPFTSATALVRSGAGNVRGQWRLRAGSIESVVGFVAARDLAFHSTAPQDLRADFKAEHQGGVWRIDVPRLALGTLEASASSSKLALSIDTLGHRAHGTIDTLPARQALELLHLASAAPDAAALANSGVLSEVRFEWGAGVDRGAVSPRQHLSAAAQWRPAGAASKAEDFTIKARLSWRESPAGLVLSADELSAARQATRLTLQGTLQPSGNGRPGSIDLTGRLAHTQIAFIRELSGDAWSRWLGPRAAALESGLLRRAQFHLTGDPAQLAAGRPIELSEGDAEVSSGTLAASDEIPAVHGIEGRLEWRDKRWLATLSAGRSGDLELESLTAGGKLDTGTFETLRIRASGVAEDIAPWILRHGQPTSGYDTLASRISGPARIDFDLHRGAGRLPHFELVLAGASVALGEQLPSVEAVRGGLVLDDGRLRRSNLEGTWLGGPAILHLNSRGKRLLVQFQGRFDAAQAARALKLDTEALQGRSAWHGEWQWRPASKGSPALWRGTVESDLFEVASKLPPPFDKAAQQPLPLKLAMEGGGDTGTVEVSAQGRVRAKLAVVAGAKRSWRVERGSFELGGGEPQLPDDPSLAVAGSLPKLDLTTILSGWRDLIAGSDAPPIRAAVDVDALTIAGRVFTNVSLDARQTNSGLQALFESKELAGRLRIASSVEDSVPAQLHLTRLKLPARTELGTLLALTDLLGSGAQLTVDNVSSGGRAQGRLTATLVRTRDLLSFDPLELSGGSYDARGTIQCAATLEACRGTVSLQTSDVAATLTALGYKDDVSAGRGLLQAALSWNPEEVVPTLTGSARISLAGGSVRRSAAPGESFPLWIVFSPLGAAQSGSMSFDRLEGEFDLREGNAYTSDLHLDGDVEVIVRGRTGLLARDYDHTAWILRGEERLPVAIRRFGAAPAVASVWLGVRDFFAAGSPRRTLHVGGTWADPVVTTQTSER